MTTRVGSGVFTSGNVEQPVTAGERRAAATPRPTNRGTCPDCGFSVRLRADGTPQTHQLYIGSTPFRLCPQGRNR